jgi:hypothetical protein
MDWTEVTKDWVQLWYKDDRSLGSVSYPPPPPPQAVHLVYCHSALACERGML